MHQQVTRLAAPIPLLTPGCLFPPDQVILRIRKKSRKRDPTRIREGAIYCECFCWTDAGKYGPHVQIAENEKLGILPAKHYVWGGMASTAREAMQHAWDYHHSKKQAPHLKTVGTVVPILTL